MKSALALSLLLLAGAAATADAAPAASTTCDECYQEYDACSSGCELFGACIFFCQHRLDRCLATCTDTPWQRSEAADMTSLEPQATGVGCPDRPAPPAEGVAAASLP